VRERAVVIRRTPDFRHARTIDIGPTIRSSTVADTSPVAVIPQELFDADVTS